MYSQEVNGFFYSLENIITNSFSGKQICIVISNQDKIQAK
jgi:hypothetical protein